MKRKLWDMKKSLVYVKIGGFFIGALFLFFITLLSVRNFTSFGGTYILRVKFNFAEGLRSSSPVRFCGVDVGEVKGVEVKAKEGSPFVIIFAKIQKGVRIPRKSYFFINSLSLFGEKYLEISPPQEIEGYLEEEELVEGISPVSLFNIFATFNKTMKEVSEFVKEGKIKTSFENTLANLEKTSLEIKGLIEDIRSKKGTVGSLLYNDSLYKKTEGLIDKTEGLIDDFGELAEDLKIHPWKLLHKPKKSRKN